MTNSVTAMIIIVALSAGSRAQQRVAVEFPPSEGMLVRIPSKGTGSQGIVVRISAPAVPRYSAGAPVAVHVAPNGVDDFPLKLTEYGFIELRFLWPGGSSKLQPDGKIWASGGAAPRGTFFGETAAHAAAAVLAFATGRTRTFDGKKLQDCIPGTRALTSNAGVIGWSVGGNLAAAAMGLYGSEFSALRWYASWESPFGDGMLDGEFGTHLQPNRFYDSQHGTLDLSALRYGKDLPITSLFGGTPEGAETVHGSLYLDGNHNGTFEKDSDFLFSGVFRAGPKPNVFYSPELTRAARAQNVFGAEWPAHIASVQQTQKFFAVQDGISHIHQVHKNIPDLAVIVEASTEDHIQTAADHPHVRIQYDAFRNAGVRWIRLNPDSHYVEWMVGRPSLRVVQNQAGKTFERSAIVPALEPSPAEGGPASTEAIAAAACELADRVQTETWSPALLGVLFPDAPIARPQKGR
jgi:hypothetical protein